MRAVLRPVIRSISTDRDHGQQLQRCRRWKRRSDGLDGGGWSSVISSQLLINPYYLTVLLDIEHRLTRKSNRPHLPHIKHNSLTLLHWPKCSLTNPSAISTSDLLSFP